jgi:8-oxo-dGTP diphosphatase
MTDPATHEPSRCPLVHAGVAAIVRRGDLILMGKRKGSHGAGNWSFPGGHQEFGESVYQAATRELREEAGLDVSPDRFRKLTFTNDVFRVEQKHYITLYVETILYPGDGEPRIMEPNKCDGWEWFTREMFTNPPAPLFLPIRNLLAERFELWPARREPT